MPQSGEELKWLHNMCLLRVPRAAYFWIALGIVLGGGFVLKKVLNAGAGRASRTHVPSQLQPQGKGMVCGAFLTSFCPLSCVNGHTPLLMESLQLCPMTNP